MKNYHKNPRILTEKQAKLLKRDLTELGDLSDIVHDINSDEIIGGNQRSTIMDVNDCEIEIVKEYDPPTKTGTVAEGYIHWQGERYTYRRVKWDKKRCEKANIVANKAGGTWDFETLANEFEINDLTDWGFEEWEFGIKQEKDIIVGEYLPEYLTFIVDQEQKKIIEKTLDKCEGQNRTEQLLWLCKK